MPSNKALQLTGLAEARSTLVALGNNPRASAHGLLRAGG